MNIYITSYSKLDLAEWWLVLRKGRRGGHLTSLSSYNYHLFLSSFLSRYFSGSGNVNCDDSDEDDFWQ
jgi:hypothetical protein